MKSYRVLIVEDEVLIADTLKRYLSERGHEVVGMALSYEEAVRLFYKTQPELVLLDIRIQGAQNGIDFARFIQRQARPCPYIFLTSQMDSWTIDQAKESFPGGYLSKPIQKHSLYATIEMVMYKHQMRESPLPCLQFHKGKRHYQIALSDILFLHSDHVYVEIHTLHHQKILCRSPLKCLLAQLPAEQFVQTHRSYIVNLQHVSRLEKDALYVRDTPIPISRSRRKAVLASLYDD